MGAAELLTRYNCVTDGWFCGGRRGPEWRLDSTRCGRLARLAAAGRHLRSRQRPRPRRPVAVGKTGPAGVTRGNRDWRTGVRDPHPPRGVDLARGVWIRRRRGLSPERNSRLRHLLFQGGSAPRWSSVALCPLQVLLPSLRFERDDDRARHGELFPAGRSALRALPDRVLSAVGSP